MVGESGGARVGADRVLRVNGHTLRHKGAPHEWRDGRWMRIHDSWEGRALCSCGATSPLLDSDRKRKAWHREHKTKIANVRGNHSGVES